MQDKGLVFISAKSEDYAYAREVYHFLASRGVEVFFSEISLAQLGEADYREAIDSALERAEHMLVVCSTQEHVNSSWVKAEWGAYVNELRSGRKDGNLVTVLAGGMGINELPLTLRQFEVVPFSSDNLFRLLPYLGYNPQQPERLLKLAGIPKLYDLPGKITITPLEENDEYRFKTPDTDDQSSPVEQLRPEAEDAKPPRVWVAWLLLLGIFGGLLFGLWKYSRPQVESLISSMATAMVNPAPTGVVITEVACVTDDDVSSSDVDTIPSIPTVLPHSTNFQGMLRLFDMRSEAEPFGHVIFSTYNDRIIATTNQHLFVWDRDGGEPLVTIELDEDSPHPVDFSPDGRTLAVGSRNSVVFLERVNWNEIGALTDSAIDSNYFMLNTLEFSPDGAQLAGGGAFGTTQTWNIADKIPLSTSQVMDARIFTVAYSPDGALIADGGQDGYLRIMVASNLSVVFEVDTGVSIRKLDFSPDGKQIAAAMGDGTVTLWELNQLVTVLPGHRGSVLDVNFSSDGELLVSGGQDGRIGIWTTHPLKNVAFLYASNWAVNDVAISPDSNTIAAAIQSGVVGVWGLPPVEMRN